MTKSKRLPFVDFDKLSSPYRIWFLAVFKRDIQEAEQAAIDAVALAQTGDDDQNPNGMYCRCHDAAVVRYARSFLGCTLPDNTGKVRLPDRYKFQGPLGVIHDQVMAARHGLVAHADLRERSVVLTKHPDGARPSWSVAISGGNLPPTELQTFISLCRLHRKTVNAELLPLIEQRLTTMKSGESVVLQSQNGGDVHWIG